MIRDGEFENLISGSVRQREALYELFFHDTSVPCEGERFLFSTQFIPVPALQLSRFRTFDLAVKYTKRIRQR